MDRVLVENILIGKGVKPTPNRILVLNELIQTVNPVSLADLEEMLDYSVDKASIFRVLELFAEKEVVHVIEDGSRSLKYEMCQSHNHHSISDQHVHFYCEKCGKIYCFKTETVPLANMPEGFIPHSVNYMIKGLCPECKYLA